MVGTRSELAGGGGFEPPLMDPEKSDVVAQGNTGKCRGNSIFR